MNAITKQILDNVSILPPEFQEETLSFVQFLKIKLINSDFRHKRAVPNGLALAQLMKEASRKNLFSHIKNPAKWQSEIRNERSLPERES